MINQRTVTIPRKTWKCYVIEQYLTFCLTVVLPGRNSHYRIVNKGFSANVRYIALLYVLFICVRKAIKAAEHGMIDKIQWPRFSVVLSSPQPSASGLYWPTNQANHSLIILIWKYCLFSMILNLFKLCYMFSVLTHSCFASVMYKLKKINQYHSKTQKIPLQY